MKRQKVYIDKQRFTKAVISFLLIMFSIALLCNIAFGDTVSKERDYVTVTVRSGDSLWKIASAHNSGGDLRKKIDDIVRFNQLSSSTLQINQKLKIPID